MSIEQIYSMIKIVCLVVFGFWLCWFLARFVIIEVRNRKNSNAPVETEAVTVQTKHPEIVIVPQGRASSNVMFITFFTDSGRVIKLHMGPRDYYAIPDSGRGQLTWQGERFWKFVPEGENAT